MEHLSHSLCVCVCLYSIVLKNRIYYTCGDRRVCLYTLITLSHLRVAFEVLCHSLYIYSVECIINNRVLIFSRYCINKWYTITSLSPLSVRHCVDICFQSCRAPPSITGASSSREQLTAKGEATDTVSTIATQLNCLKENHLIWL